MNQPLNENLKRLRNQLENSTNINSLNKRPNNRFSNNRSVNLKNITKTPVPQPNKFNRKQVRKALVPKRKLVTKKVSVPKKNLVSKRNSEPTRSYLWSFIYILLFLVSTGLIGVSVYNLYNYTNAKPEQTNQNTYNVIKVPMRPNKPKGVILNKVGAPVKNKKPNDYLSYSEFPKYYSRMDDGVTKTYYENVLNNNRQEINKYIRNQNNYIRNVNERIRQINRNRMNTPGYDRDRRALNAIRNYERILANKVYREQRNGMYSSS